MIKVSEVKVTSFEVSVDEVKSIVASYVNKAYNVVVKPEQLTIMQNPRIDRTGCRSGYDTFSGFKFRKEEPC